MLSKGLFLIAFCIVLFDEEYCWYHLFYAPSSAFVRIVNWFSEVLSPLGYKGMELSAKCDHFYNSVFIKCVLSNAKYNIKSLNLHKNAAQNIRKTKQTSYLSVILLYLNRL